MWHGRNNGSRRVKASIKTRERNRLNGPAPDVHHMPDTSRPTIRLIAYHSGLNVSHVFEFYPSLQHCSQYRLVVDGQEIRNGKTQNGLFGWSEGLAVLRKAFPRIGRFDV